MKNKAKTALMNLSIETKKLVNQGVFSLYSITAGATNIKNAAFVLYTAKRSFLLDDSGVVVKEDAPSMKVKVEHAVKFPELSATETDTIKKFA